MVDTFTVDPKRLVLYKEEVFSRTLGRINVNGVFTPIGNRFGIDNSFANLTFKVKTGGALIDGHYVELTVLSDLKTMPASVTRDIFISLVKVSGEVSDAQIEILAVGTVPTTPYIKIAQLITNATIITTVTEFVPGISGIIEPDTQFYPLSTTIGDYTLPTAAETNFYDNTSNLSDQFTTNIGWTQVGTLVTVDDVSFPDVCKFNVAPVNADRRVHKAIGATLNAADRFRMRIKVNKQAHVSTYRVFLGWLQAGTGVPRTAIVDKLGIYADSNGVFVGFVDGATGFSLSTGLAALGDAVHFLQLEHLSSTSVRFSKWTDATYSVKVAEETVVIPAGITGLDTVHIGTRDDGAVGETFTAELDDLDIVTYNTDGDSARAFDNNTATKWKSDSAVGVWIFFTMSAAADKEPSAIALYVDKSAITALQFKIQTSPDGTTWTDRRLVNVSALVDLAYNYIRLNRNAALIRYIRFLVTDGTAKTFSINEIRAEMPTAVQWNTRHGHKTIPADNATIALIG